LPKSGMMRNGKIYALPMSERPTGGNVSGLWPTPTRFDYNTAVKSRTIPGSETYRGNLKEAVQMWPTPTCNMVSGGPNHNSPQVIAGNHGINLHGAVLKQQAMWPTPTKHNAQETGAPSQMDRNTPQLGDLVADRNGGQLSPRFVEYLMNYPKDWTSLDNDTETHYTDGISTNGGSDAKDSQSRSRKDLQVLRDGDESEKIQRTDRRYDRICKKKILQSIMHGKGLYSKRCESCGFKKTSDEVSREQVRSMRIDKNYKYTSFGLKPSEQFTRQPNDIMQFMSHEMALDTRQENAQTTDYLQDMRRAFKEIGYVPETLSEIQEVWRSITDEEKDWIKIRISTGNPWHSEWPGVPRVANGVKDRVNRLKCLGNSIVPQIAELIFRQPAFDDWRQE